MSRSKRSPRFSSRQESASFQPSSAPKCTVCHTPLDPPVIALKTPRGRAHILCLALDKVGLGGLARTSGRI